MSLIFGLLGMAVGALCTWCMFPAHYIVIAIGTLGAGTIALCLYKMQRIRIWFALFVRRHPWTLPVFFFLVLLLPIVSLASLEISRRHGGEDDKNQSTVLSKAGTNDLSVAVASTNVTAVAAPLPKNSIIINIGGGSIGSAIATIMQNCQPPQPPTVIIVTNTVIYRTEEKIVAAENQQATIALPEPDTALGYAEREFIIPPNGYETFTAPPYTSICAYCPYANGDRESIRAYYDGRLASEHPEYLKYGRIDGVSRYGFQNISNPSRNVTMRIRVSSLGQGRR